MDIAKWDNLNLEMSPDQVIEILGKPTKNNESLNKRIDFVFIYKRVLSDSKLEGFVRFRKGLVVEIEKPKIHLYQRFLKQSLVVLKHEMLN